MSNFKDLLAQYDYPLTKEMIALQPAVPRDSSKLLAYNRAEDKTSFHRFSDIGNHLPQGSVLVFNETKVIPARIYGHIATGGMVEVLCTTIGQNNTFQAIINRNLYVGATVRINDDATLAVVGKHESTYTLMLTGTKTIQELLSSEGTTPLPPYLKHSPLNEKRRRERYQSVFAKNPGSIAAPTASLHFTKELLDQLEKQFEFAYVTLHVGLGTFAPLTEKHIASGQLHEEQYEITPENAAIIEKAKREGRAVVAVGTTALRTLESAADESGIPAKLSGPTTLFIRPGHSHSGHGEPYHFTCATGLVTNFHVPRSSLMMLVAAMTGRKKLLELYAEAASRGFRFLSFGDAMLII